MAFTTEEQALRSALDEATLGQPEAPVDRSGAVRRRYLRRRQLQGVAAAVAVVVVAAGAVVVGGRLPGHRAAEPLNRQVPSWALRWDDHRDGSVPQKVLDGAVRQWRHLLLGRVGAVNPGLASGSERPIWYVGQRVAEGGAVVVVFEVGSDRGNRLVAGWATASEVMRGQPPYINGQSPWVLYDTSAPPPDYHGVIGVNLHGDGTNTGAGGYEFPDAWVVLLGRPDATRAVVPPTGSHALVRGYTAFDAGQLESGPLQVTMQFKDGTATTGVVGVPGNPHSRVVQLAAVPPLTNAADADVSTGGQGQAMATIDAGSAGQGGTVRVRCRGVGRIRIAVAHSVPGSPDREHVVTRPCDDTQFAISVPPLDAHQTFRTLEVRASDYAAWQVAFVLDHQ